MAQKKEPAKSIRLGRIKLTIWKNQSKKGGTFFSIEIVRSYMEGDKWQHSTTYGRDDLPIVSKATDMAYAWIWSQECSASPEPDEQAIA